MQQWTSQAQQTPQATPTSEQRKREWRLILLIAAATLAVLFVVLQCGLDVAIIGRLPGN